MNSLHYRWIYRLVWGGCVLEHRTHVRKIMLARYDGPMMSQIKPTFQNRFFGCARRVGGLAGFGFKGPIRWLLGELKTAGCVYRNYRTSTVLVHKIQLTTGGA